MSVVMGLDETRPEAEGGSRGVLNIGQQLLACYRHGNARLDASGNALSGLLWCCGRWVDDYAQGPSTPSSSTAQVDHQSCVHLSSVQTDEILQSEALHTLAQSSSIHVDTFWAWKTLSSDDVS